MSDATGRTSLRPVLVYSLYRLLILLASLAVLFLIGMRGWWWLIVSVIIAAPVAYLSLPGPRVAAAAALQERAEQRERTRAARAKVDVDQAAEDAVADLLVPTGPASAESARPAPPEGEGEGQPDHELEAPHLAQDGDEPRS